MIDPVAFHLGPIKVYWYGIGYSVSLLLGLFYGQWLIKKKILPITNKNLDSLFIYFVVAIIIGGRLGHVIFYDLNHFLSSPINIFKTWEGGMSFHGGVIGVIIACYLFSKKHNVPFFVITDYLGSAVPIGIFFGRISNFINQELYGIPTDLPWGVQVRGIEGLRHPTQLYEAGLEGLLMGLILFIIYQKFHKINGYTSALFLVTYGALRFPIEFLKDMPTVAGSFSQGHLLNIAMVIAGAFFLIRFQKAHD